MSKSLDHYKKTTTHGTRLKQAELADFFIEQQSFDKIEAIETGCSSGVYDNFGVYLSEYVKEKGGTFSTVDISQEYINKSKAILGDGVNYHVGDSIDFLKTYKGNPNLVHLDSYDLDINNPLPAMLHCWLEFNAIKDKMPKGSIVLIDDNFFRGTIVYWNTYIGNKLSSVKEVPISMEIIGKGGMVYHWIKNYKTEWVLLGDHYDSEKNGYENVKLILKKI